MTSENPEWVEQADENTERWGVQPPEDVVLAIMEELAEVTDELFQHSDATIERYSRQERELLFLLSELATLGEEIQSTLERTYEDEDGNPLPKSDRPRVLGELRESEPVQDEVDDLGALVYQLRESVNEHSKW